SILFPYTTLFRSYMANTGNSRLLLKVVFGLSLAMIVPASLGFIYSEWVLALLFGIEFQKGREILRVFVLTGFIGFISVFMGYPAFASLKRVDIANKSVIISGSCLLLMLLIL